MSILKTTSLCLLVVSALACGDPECAEDTSCVASASVPFSATVDGTEFSCGQDYTVTGTSETQLTLNDLRFYVYDFELVNADDKASKVTLTADGKWQVGGSGSEAGVALLDFEDGSSGCDAGNADMNTEVLLQELPAGDYAALRFKVGVPFALNHQDAAIADAPMNLTSMFWNWNGGYKFMRLDGATTGVEGWRFHFGSTGCDGDMMGNVTACNEPNRVQVEVPASFSVGGANTELPTINFDVARLVSGVDLDSFTPDTPPGCMGSSADPDCEHYFANLGLPWQGADASPQTVFTAE